MGVGEWVGGEVNLFFDFLTWTLGALDEGFFPQEKPFLADLLSFIGEAMYVWPIRPIFTRSPKQYPKM